MLKWATAVYTLIAVISVFIFVTRLEAIDSDPFVSIVDAQVQGKKTAPKVNVDLSGVVLKGIIWNKLKSVAIINDEPIGVGDEWRGLKVESIEQDKVILSDGEKNYPLFVQQDSPSAKAGSSNKGSISEPERMRQNKEVNPYGPAGLSGQEESRQRPDMSYRRE